MHENANIAYQIKETQSILLTIMESQPQTSGGAEGQQTDTIVFDLANLVTDSILPRILTDEANINMFKVRGFLYLNSHKIELILFFLLLV